MPVSRLAVVDEATTEQLWELYREGFGPLATRAVTRQVLYRHEFLERMRDGRVWKFVQRDEGGAVVGLATLTRHLETVVGISPDYFAARWPQEYAEGRVYYVGFVLVVSERRRQGLYAELVQAVVHMIARARAVAGFDICAYNLEVLDVLRATGRGAGPEAVPDLLTLDTQTYYAVSFRQLGSAGPTQDGRVIDLTGTPEVAGQTPP
jgi:GNAT superfamily N-acetyltransferase